MKITTEQIKEIMELMKELKECGKSAKLQPLLAKHRFAGGFIKSDFDFIYDLKQIEPIHARKVIEAKKKRVMWYNRKKKSQRTEQPKPQPQPIRPIEEKPKSPVLPQPKPIATKEAKEVKKESKTKKNMKAKKEQKGMSLFDKVRLTILKARKERIERKIAKIKGINIKK